LPLEALTTLDEELESATADYPNPTQTLIVAQDDYETLLVDLVTGIVSLEYAEDYTAVSWLHPDGPGQRWADWATFLASLHRVPVPEPPPA